LYDFIVLVLLLENNRQIPDFVLRKFLDERLVYQENQIPKKIVDIAPYPIPLPSGKRLKVRWEE